MQKLRMGLAILGTLAVAGVSQAAIGTVDMTWDSCTGPIDKTSNGGGVYNLFVTVIGHDEVQTAYEFEFVYGNASQQVPDAWRFDADACEDGLLTQDVISKGCPPFARTRGALVIKRVEFSPSFGNYPTTVMRVLLAYAIPSAQPRDSVHARARQVRSELSSGPGARTPGVTCGGFEHPMCFQLSHAGWVDTVERFFDRSDPVVSVSFNGGHVCPRRRCLRSRRRGVRSRTSIADEPFLNPSRRG